MDESKLARAFNHKFTAPVHESFAVGETLLYHESDWNFDAPVIFRAQDGHDALVLFRGRSCIVPLTSLRRGLLIHP